MPPLVRPAGGRLLRLEDVDRGVKAWFNSIVSGKVSDPAGEKGSRRDVHVTFAAGERWVAAADRQGVRDKDGQLILPVIEVSRQGFSMEDNMTALGANVPTMQIARLVSPKTAQLAAADDIRPISQRRLRSGAVYDIYTIPFPVNGTMPYKVRVQTQYQQQMNELVEKMLYNLEFFDVPSFLIEIDGDPRPQGLPTGLGSTEKLPADHQRFGARHPLSSHYVVGYVDGSLADEGNFDEFTDQERIIQLQFGFKVPVALQLDPEGERPAVQKETTAFRVELEAEECHFVDSSEQLDAIFGPK